MWLLIRERYRALSGRYQKKYVSIVPAEIDVEPLVLSA